MSRVGPPGSGREAAPFPAAVAAFVDALVEAGVRSWVVSPGARSAPLALALARRPDVRAVVHADERAAGYLALGASRAGRPAAAVCTSGTAAANLVPALCEAAAARVPVLFVTADRPARVRDWGAHQTIRQPELFAAHARWSTELHLPPDGRAAREAARAVALRAVRAALGPRPGPVHVNVPLEEPLPAETADPAEGAPPQGDGRTRASGALAALSAPAPRSGASSPAPGRTPAPDARAVGAARLGPPPREALEAAAARLRRETRICVVCGPEAPDAGLGRALARFAGRVGATLVCDGLGAVRASGIEAPHLVATHDALLRDPALAARLAPGAIVEAGLPPASRALRTWAAAAAAPDRIALDPFGEERDPELRGAIRLAGDARAALAALAREGAGPRDARWLEAWRRAERAARATLARALAGARDLAGPTIVDELARALPAGVAWFVGNSLPVRDVDAFLVRGARGRALFGQRGASGIDGCVAHATGLALALGRPVAALLGDLALAHDVGALAAAARERAPVLLVVVANGGGGIFRELPLARGLDRGTLERFFVAPPEVDLEGAARFARIGFARAEKREELARAVAGFLRDPRPLLVEARVDPVADRALARALREEAAASARRALGVTP